jgi:CubicO group peptidase (beta-lactamase class C family)
MILRATPVLLLLALLLPASLRAEEKAPPPSKPPASLDALLEPFRKKHDVPALGGGVVVGERLVAVGATGVRRRGAKAKVTAKDLWHIGSCTKAMTATLVGKLVDAGKLEWTTTLEAAFPDLGKKIHSSYRKVTLADLLAHRAGTPNDLRPDGLWARLWKHEGPPLAARRTLAESVLAKAPAATPGTRYLYSNAGYAIAGHVAERVARKGWEELVRAELFEPLGMTAVGFGPPGSGEGLGQPQGHRADGTPVPPGPGADNPPAIGPAGTVHCSIESWARFVSLHLRGARDGEEKLLLERETLREIQRPRRGQTYALGWQTAERPWGGGRPSTGAGRKSGRVLTHAGSNTMWFAVAWLAPRRGFAVLVTVNQGGEKAAKAADEAAGALIRWHLGREAK